MPTARLDDGARLLAFVATLATLQFEVGTGVLTDPGDNLNERTIQSSSNRKQESIRQSRKSRLRNGKLGNETTSRDRVASHDERRTLLDILRPEGKDQHHDHSEDVDRDRQELSIGGVVSKVLDHSWHSCSKAIDADGVGPEHDPGTPD
jgi:hypothetical protein